MTTKKIDKLEQRLYRIMKDIKDAPGPKELTEYIRRFGRLECQYFGITGTRFNPARGHEELQDVEWKY